MFMLLEIDVRSATWQVHLLPHASANTHAACPVLCRASTRCGEPRKECIGRCGNQSEKVLHSLVISSNQQLCVMTQVRALVQH